MTEIVEEPEHEVWIDEVDDGWEAKCYTERCGWKSAKMRNDDYDESSDVHPGDQAYERARARGAGHGTVR